MADFGVKVAAAVEVDKGQFLSQLQAIAEGVTVKVGVEMDEASRSKFLNSLKNIVPKTPVKVKVEPETAGRSSFAKQLSSVAGRVDVGKKMQVSKTGLTSVAKQVQSGLDRTKLTLKLNKIDADAPIKDIGKQIKAEVATVSVGDGVKLDGDALGVSGVDNVLAQTAEMTSKAVEGLGEAKSATASWKDQLKDLDRIMKSVTKSRDSATRGKSNVLTDSSNVAKTEAEYQRLADSIRKIRDAETPVENSVIAGLEREAAAYEVLVSKMREAESAAKASSSASAQSASKELAAQRKLMDTLEARANKVYENALTSKNPMLTDAGDIAEFQVRYQSLANEIREVNRAMNEGGTVDSARIASIEKETAALNQLAVARKKAAEASRATNADAKKSDARQLSYQQKQLESIIGSVSKRYNDALFGKNRLVSLKENVSEITSAYSKLDAGVREAYSSGKKLSEERISSLREEAAAVRDLIDKKVELEAQDRIVEASQNNASVRQINTLRDQMTRFLQSNTRVLDTSLGSEVSSMLSRIESGAKISTDELNNMRNAFARVKVEARQAGVMGKTFSDSVMDAYQRFGGWSIITNSLGHAVMAVREMITNVVNLDTAMTELKKVTDETDSTYEQFFSGAANRAREFGATVTDTITATADFARLGYDIDQASALADAALVYKNVGDGIENISDASDSIISTMMAFDDLEGRDPMRIVDAFNELGNNFAISSEGLGEALTRSASGLAAANNTFEESAALVTAMNSTVQDPQKVGTTLKTVSMYLRAAKVEAEEAGVETEGMANSVSKLREDVMALTNGKVDIMLDDSTFKSTYQIMEEISEVWDEMTDVDQAALLEMIGGKRNSDAVMSLIKNFDVAKAALQDALGSEGSALAENEKYLDSIAGRVQKFKASFEELSSAFIDSDFAKGVVSFGDTVLRGLTGIVENLGSIPSLIAAIVSSISMIRGLKGNDQGLLSLFTLTGEKGHEKLGMFGNSFSDIASTFKEMRANGSGIFESFKKATGPLAGASKYIEKYNSLLGSSNDLLEEHYQKTAEYSRSLAQYLRQAGPEGGSLSGYDSYLKKSGNSVKKLGIGAKAASVGMNALKSAMNGMLVGLVTFGITTLIEKIVELAQATEKAVEEADASATELNEKSDALNGYKDRIFELREAIDSGNLSQEEARQKREELLGIGDELVSMYGREAQGINLLSGSYSELNSQLDALGEKDWRQWSNQNQKGIQESIDVMTNPSPSDIEGVGQTGTGSGGYRFFIPRKKDLESAISDLNMEYSVDDFYRTLQSEFDERKLDIQLELDDDGNFTGKNFIDKNLDNASLQEIRDYYQGVYDAVNESIGGFFGEDNIGQINGAQRYLDSIQENIDTIDAAIAKHQNNLNTQAQGMLEYEGAYSSFWDSVKQAEENYSNAALEGNLEDQGAAIKQMEALQLQYQSNVQNGVEGWDEEVIQSYLDNYFKVFEEESKDVAVKLDLKADMEDEEGFKASIIDAVNQFKGEDGIVDVDEIVNVGLDMEARGRNINSPDLTGDEKAYLSLKEAMDRYDISVEQLCADLTELGYIQDGVTEGPRKIYDSFQNVQASAESVKTMISELNGVYLDNTYLTEDAYNAIDQLVGSEIDLSSCIDTNNGYLVTNAAKLAEVVEAAQEYAAANLEISRSHELTNYHKLVSELGQLTSGTKNYTEAQQAQVNAILETMDKTKLQIEQFGLLKEQILGTTSGFDELASAKEYDAVSDYTDDLASAFTDIFTLYKNKEFGTEAFQSAFDMLVPENIYDKFVDAEDQIQAGWKYLNGRVSRYFDYNDGNVSIDFDNTKKFVQDALNTAYEGSTVFTGTLEDFDLSPQIDSVYELAEAMGVTEEVAFGMITAINKYNADGDNMFSEFIDGFDGEVYELQNKLAELYDEEYKLALSGKLEGTEGAQVTLDIQEAEAQLDTLRQEAAQDFHAYIEVDSDIKRTEDTIAQLKEDLKGMEENSPEFTFKTNRLMELEAKLRKLKTEKAQLTQPTELALTLASEYIEGELSRLKGELNELTGQEYQAEVTTYVATDPESQAKVDEIVAKIQSLEGDQSQINVYLNADTEEAKGELQSIQDFTINDKPFSVLSNIASVMGQLGVLDRKQISNKSFTVSYTVQRKGTGSVLDGTAGGSGFSGLGFYRGTAYARGTLGIKHPERNALVGELGPEMYVDPRTGVYRTVGEYGAELIDLPRGAIIFNHIQTEQILKNRRINTRGKVYGSGSMEGSGAAYANGTMHAEGKSHFTFVDGDFTFGGSGASGGGSSHSSNSNKGSSSTHTVKVEADATDLEEQLKDTLDKIKEEIDDIIGNLEHEIFLLEKNHGDPDEIVSIYREMQDQVHAYAEKYRAQGLDENSDYIQDLQKQWWEYQESIQEVIVDTYEKATQEQENAITLTENWLDNAFADRDFKNVQIYVDDIVSYYEKMQQIIHEQAEYYRSQGYSDTSDEVSELSDLWWDYEENIKEVKQQVVDHLIEMVDTASEAVDNIQDVMDTFKDAADEYAKNGGFISVDAFQEIVKLGPQYMQYLEDENGLLQINEESINRVIAAKTEQLALESAMNYIERLRLALQAESIEDLNNLLYATTETTNATWGLVYANLALLDLTGPQYEAALHNINAIRALAQNAISGIGKVTGEAEENLQDMKDGLDDILQYVMDMLEDRVQRQIDALEEMKDSYAELIELKKESMEATKEETDYQDEVADKVKEIADLQARINALSLDDSRDAQAQRIELEEQMAELQRELSDTQADYAIDRQEESLDKMQDAYEEQKDQEIEKLEQTISSQEKLYQMAIDYIESHWDTLYSELISWNYEYGSVLNKEITEAWNNCLAAAQKYGSYVNALNQIDADIENMGSDHSNNITIGKPVDDNSYTNLDMVRAIVSQMKVLSGQWDAENKSEAENDALHDKASALAARLGQYGVVVKYRGSDGTWWIERDELNPGNAGQLLYSRYHSGGIVGDQPTVKQNEVLALLEKGEAVLDKQKEKGLYRLIDFASDISEKLRASIGIADLSGVVDRMRDNMNSIQTEALAGVTNNVGAIQFGDVYIYGSDGDTVQQHIDVNRRFVNEVLDRLNIRK